MERILMSQHEDNNGTDYVVLNGKLLQDRDDIREYVRKIIDTEDFKVKYSDEYITISQKDNKILFSSNYENKDNVGRKIYYMYLIDDSVDLETILEYLERDSMVLNRQFDREKTIEIIDRIRNNDTLRINLVKWILSAIVSAGALYLFSKIINND
jgi:hypothetical protein